SGTHRVLVRLEPDGHPQVLDPTAGGTLDVRELDAVGIADNGTIVALTSSGDHLAPAVVAVTADGTVSMPFRDDSTSARVLGFEVVGSRLLLALEHYPTDTTIRLLDLDTGEWTDRLPPGVIAPGELDYVLDTSRTNDVLYLTYGDPDQYWLLAGAEPQPIAAGQQESPRPVALRSADALLFVTDTYTIGAARTVLSSTAAHIAGRCVAPAVAMSSHDSGGCAIADVSTPGPWPLLGAVACAVLTLCARRGRRSPIPR
ncbi:MAG TPA: hypothetical protein VL049_16040, partial [Candidatus Dormibacteraeota bacterium]|nr:hypothetical protein [Candidatus Dormibacteraeota bacterium]